MFFYRIDFCLVLRKILFKICGNPLKRTVFHASKYGSQIHCEDISFVYDTLKVCNGEKNPDVTLIQTQGTMLQNFY